MRYVSTLLLLALITFAAKGETQTTKPSTPFKVEITGHGPPMILIPGLGCSGEVWKETVAHFQDRYECQVLTLAGFAGEKPVDAPILSTIRDGLIQYIHEKKLNKPILVGHSVGGFLAFSVASADPDSVGSIIAVDGVPFLPALLDPTATADTMRPRADMMRKQLKSLAPMQFQFQNAMTLTRMVTKPDDLERIRKWMGASDQNTIADVMYEAFTTDLREPVAKIKTPVLLIAAGADDTTPEARKKLEESYRQQISRIAGAQVVVAEKAKHFIMIDDPSFLFTQMETFLRQAPKQ